jgi:hypothetical protein
MKVQRTNGDMVDFSDITAVQMVGADDNGVSMVCVTSERFVICVTVSTDDFQRIVEERGGFMKFLGLCAKQ